MCEGRCWCDIIWRKAMTRVRMQWLGTSILGLGLLLQGCAVGSSDLRYHLALESDPSTQKPECTVVLKSVVDDTLNGNSGPLGNSSSTIRDFQIALERQLHQTVKGLACSPEKKTPLSKVRSNGLLPMPMRRRTRTRNCGVLRSF